MTPPRDRRKDPGRRDLWLALLAGAGVLLSGYLTVTKLLHAPIYCLAGSGCEIVQSSRFAAVFGIPVALFGLVFYAALLFLAVRPLTAAARWAWAFPFAAAGFAATLVFVVVAELVVRATCTLCLGSALLVLVILLRAFLRRPQQVRTGTWTWSGVAALAAVVFLAAGYAGSTPQAGPSTYVEGLARHLTQSGARFYGAYWCPHCKDQKEMFGGAERLLPYVECDPRDPAGQPQVCAAAGVRAYPTWEINGQRYEGVLTLEDLARLSGYRPTEPGSGNK